METAFFYHNPNPLSRTISTIVQLLTGSCFAAFLFCPPAHGEASSPIPAFSAEPKPKNPVSYDIPLLASDEPNNLGVRKDSSDQKSFLDFTLSMRYPLLFKTLDGGEKYQALPFFAFSTRMSQYFDRHSAPVVTKKLNPRVFMRFYGPNPSGKSLWSEDNALDYYDLGYGHESNGQTVDSTASFANAVNMYGSTLIAQDYVSRGWDYVGYSRHLQMYRNGLNSLDFESRYFLTHGLLQSHIEQYGSWEGPSAITRISQVNGLRIKSNFKFDRTWFKGASLSFTTGYENPLRYNTLETQIGFTPLSDLLGVPIIIWGRTGYNEALSNYNQKNWSIGLAASFETFN